MLEWTLAGDGARLMMLVYQDAAKREYAYGPADGLPDIHVGTFSDELLAERTTGSGFLRSTSRPIFGVLAFDPRRRWGNHCIGPIASMPQTPGGKAGNKIPALRYLRISGQFTTPPLMVSIIASACWRACKSRSIIRIQPPSFRAPFGRISKQLTRLVVTLTRL